MTSISCQTHAFLLLPGILRCRVVHRTLYFAPLFLPWLVLNCCFDVRNSGDVGIDLSFSHVPKILAGCLHTICQSCAEEALQRSDVPSAIPCPVCRRVTTGISCTDGLTNNVLALQEIQRRSKQCDYCDDLTDASHRCIECKSLLCSFHVKAHTRSRGTKTHNIFQLRGSNSGVGAAATGVVRRLPIACPRHAGVPAKLFCSEPCGALMCHDCSVVDHSGHKIFLADSEEVEVIHRTGLTRRTIDLGHRYGSASYESC